MWVGASAPTLPVSKRTKSDFRNYFRNLRTRLRHLFPQSLKTAEELINLNLIKFINTSKFKRIALYWPIHEEVNLKPTIDYLKNKKTLLLPFVEQTSTSLTFYTYSDSHRYEDALGFSLPIAKVSMAPDLIILPLVAVSIEGFRLGYGGGYYDRTLENHFETSKIGIGFSFQVCSIFDRQDHDSKMDAFISEIGIKYF